MAQRDLTFNSPNVMSNLDDTDDNSQIHRENPFASVDDESGSFGSLNRRTSSVNLDPLSPGHNYGNNYGNYDNFKGYYAQNGNGTTSHLLSNESSSVDIIEGGSSSRQQNLPPLTSNVSLAQNIQVPPEYDRYPSMIGSRAVSYTSLSSHFNQNKEKTSEDSSSGSNNTSNPFLIASDFSPFGGYPALSFPLHIDEKEPDDYIHNPDPIADAKYDKNRFYYDLKNMDRRSLAGFFAFIFLFIVGGVIFVLIPALTYSGVTYHATPESYEILTKYHYPLLSAIRTNLVDPDTPSEYYYKESRKGDKWKLVFSDEFAAEGRTFYPGDDQFFTAADLNYAATKDLEWYDPDAATTAKGTLNLRMDAFKNRGCFYRSGMLQSWNKLCFTQGYIEFSARLPNYGNVPGLWPGLWTMGNLGRPGYMASTEGVWPYTYEECDAGITANQSSPDGISYLPGQKLNSCTCKGESHPNPGVGRGAPEIDAIEAEFDSSNRGVASQSMQVAPFDIWYMPDYNFMQIHNKSVTTVNTYAGGPIQQAVSATTTLNYTWYEFGVADSNRQYQRYGFEYLNDDDTGYLTFYVGEDPTMTIHNYALGPNGNIGRRYISKEPMSMVMNLGISNSWAYIDWPSINFPVTFSIDYVRIYQPEDSINLTCDPDDFPTYDYIQDHLNAYLNVNLTTWEAAGYTFPKNKLVNNCS